MNFKEESIDDSLSEELSQSDQSQVIEGFGDEEEDDDEEPEDSDESEEDFLSSISKKSKPKKNEEEEQVDLDKLTKRQRMAYLQKNN